MKGFFSGLKSIIRSASSIVPYLISSGDMRKEVTEQYPDPISSRTDDDLPARTRGILFNEIDRCTGCGKCVEVCPVKCIELETDSGPSDERKWVSVFDIDLGKCVFCGYCVEICPPSSLVHTKQFEGAVFNPNDLRVSFGKGFVSKDLREKWERLREMEDEL